MDYTQPTPPHKMACTTQAQKSATTSMQQNSPMSPIGEHTPKEHTIQNKTESVPSAEPLVTEKAINESGDVK